MERFELFMKGQQLERDGSWHEAYDAYTRAGAYQCAEKMKTRAKIQKRLRNLPREVNYD